MKRSGIAHVSQATYSNNTESARASAKVRFTSFAVSTVGIILLVLTVLFIIKIA